MESNLAKIEKITFRNDNLFCPVIENEPMIIVNLIIKNIGLNYDTQIIDFNNSRFSKKSGSIKIIKNSEKKYEILYNYPEFNMPYGMSNDQKSKENNTFEGAKTEFNMPYGMSNSKEKTKTFSFYENQIELLDQLFDEIGGYEYVVLPIRKLAGWLYSINPNRVKPAIKEKLETYQDECDEILYQHFFGPISKRKKLLIERTDMSMNLTEMEKQLMEIPIFVEYINLKMGLKNISKMLKSLDKDVIDTQRNLF